MDGDGFFVQVALEADEDYAVADILYRGRQVAAVRVTPGMPEVVTYEADRVPLDGLIAALGDAGRRLGHDC